MGAVSSQVYHDNKPKSLPRFLSALVFLSFPRAIYLPIALQYLNHNDVHRTELEAYFG